MNDLMFPLLETQFFIYFICRYDDVSYVTAFSDTEIALTISMTVLANIILPVRQFAGTALNHVGVGIPAILAQFTGRVFWY